MKDKTILWNFLIGTLLLLIWAAYQKILGNTIYPAFLAVITGIVISYLFAYKIWIAKK